MSQEEEKKSNNEEDHNQSLNNGLNENNNNNIEDKNTISLKKSRTLKFSDKLRINITIIGKKKCGKSALIKSYLEKSFENSNKDTALDIFGKKILIYGHEVNLVISEVSQDKTNFQLAKEVIGASHIVFICYSLEDDFQKMNEDVIEGSISLIETINKKIPIFIVGCKFDLIKEENIDIKKIINDDELTMSGKNVHDYINNRRENLENNFCGFYITSSLLNLNIQELFNDAIRTVAIPYVKNYQKKLDNFNATINVPKIETNNKKRKQDSTASNNNNINQNEEKKLEITVEDNGCVIF